MEHVVVFVCIQLKLQTLLCYSYTYDIIFIIKLYVASKKPHPMKNYGCATVISTRTYAMYEENFIS